MFNIDRDTDPAVLEAANQQLALVIKDGYEMACVHCDQLPDHNDNCACPKFEPTGTATPEGWDSVGTDTD